MAQELTAADDIAAAIPRFKEAYDAGDLQTIAAYYSESLIKLREGAPPEGKAEVIRRVGSTLRDFTGHLEVTNDEIAASGELAFTRGSFVLTLTPRKGGPATVIRRRFLEVWRKERGRWVVCRAMDNSGPP